MTETIRYSLIGKEDVKTEPRNGAFEVTLADGRTVVLSALDVAYFLSDSFAAVPSPSLAGRLYRVSDWMHLDNGAAVFPLLTLPPYARASLPTAGTVGRLARVTDRQRGLWLDTGSLWAPLTGQEINAQRDFGATGDGVTIDTAALQAAIAAAVAEKRRLYVPAGDYVVDDSLVLTGISPFWLRGDGLDTRFLNKASANKPTFRLAGKEFFVLENFTIVGVTGFPNDGIFTTVDSAAVRTAFGLFRNILNSPNGNAWHLQDCNTLALDECQAWPSSLTGYGTFDGSNNKNAVLADGANAVNEILVRRLNSVNYASIANGGAALRWNTTTVSLGLAFEDCELESTGRAIDLANVQVVRVQGAFGENADHRFLNCRYIRIRDLEGGSTATITIGDGTAPNQCIDVIAENCLGKSLIVDTVGNPQCQGCGARDSTVSVAPGYQNNGTARVTQNVRTTGAVLVADEGANVGFRERDRSFGMGEWTTPAYAGGNFTQTGGTSWTVDAGDVDTLEYTLVGKLMTVNFYLKTTSVVGTPTSLDILIPGSFTAAKRAANPILTQDNGGTYATGYAEVTAAGTKINCYKTAAAAAWSAAANNTEVRGQLTFEVQ